MTGFDRKTQSLTPKQVRALQALLVEPTLSKAARIAGVSESTLFRWLNSEDFNAAYLEARARLLDDALTVIQSAAADSARFLQELVNDREAPKAVRLRAACEILSFSLKEREVFETEERLAALEALLQGGAPTIRVR